MFGSAAVTRICAVPVPEPSPMTLLAYLVPSRLMDTASTMFSPSAKRRFWSRPPTRGMPKTSWWCTVLRAASPQVCTSRQSNIASSLIEPISLPMSVALYQCSSNGLTVRTW